MTPGLRAGCQPCLQDWGLFHVCKTGAEAAVCVLPSFQSSPARSMELYLGNHNRGRERHTQKEREGRNGINCLWLWLIFIGLLVFDSSPFLCSFLTFHKWPSTLESIVQQGQQVPQKLAVTSAGPIHTSTPSMALCHSTPGSALPRVTEESTDV